MATVEVSDHIIDAPVERQYSLAERQLRDKYVREYIVDYDVMNAAIRVGYMRALALEYGQMFMQEPYVQRKILELQNQIKEKPEDSGSEIKNQIIAGLLREANYRGPGSTQAARVAALSKLASLHGMDPVSRSQVENTSNGPMAGMFLVPGIMTPEQWEAAAQVQQDKLVAAQVEHNAPQLPPPTCH